MSRAADALLGFAIGDALGMPFSWSAPSNIPPTSKLEMVDWPRATTTHPCPPHPKGTWSARTTAVLAMITVLRAGAWDALEGQEALVWQLRSKEWTGSNSLDGLDGRGMDETTKAVLMLAQLGVPVPDAADVSARASNHPLFRAFGAALAHGARPPEELAQIADEQAAATHRQKVAGASSELLALFVLFLLRGGAEPFDQACRGLAPESQACLQRLGLYGHQPAGSSEILDSMLSALLSRRLATPTKSFRIAVQSAIRLGNDTASTAALAGGLAAAAWGREAIPRRWIEALRGQDILERYAKELP